MIWERIKLALVVVFFAGILVFTGRAQKDVLAQKDPKVLNFLTAAYCPDMVQAGQTRPLTTLRLLVKSKPADPAGRARWEQEMRRAGLDVGLEPWETRAAKRHAQGQAGYPQAWQVRFLEMPALGMGGARDSWALTRLMGGEAPEFMWSMATPEYRDTCAKWYVDLSPYLNRPNPDALDGQGKPIRWLDLFYPDSVGRWRATEDKHLYLVPIDQVEIAIYYNEDILQACGIDVADPAQFPPRDWADFIALQQRIQDAGQIPFLMTANNSMRLGWIMDILNDMLWAGVYDRINQYDDPDMPGTTGIDGQEKIAAFKTGAISLDDDRHWEVWRIVKEWSQYWQPGFLSTGDQLRFQRGEVAMTVDGSWFVRTLENDTKRTFRYGTFFIPSLTRRTSHFVADPPSPARGVGGSTAIQYSITRETAGRKEAVEACVDLLMYITAPQNIGPMVAEGQSFLPTVRGAPLAEKLKFMLPVLEAGAVRCNGIDNLDARCTDERWAAMQYYLEDRKDPWDRRKVLEVLKPAVERAMAEQLVKYKDTWKWLYDEQGRQTWKIEPPVSRLRPEDLPTTGPGVADAVWSTGSASKPTSTPAGAVEVQP